MRVLLSRFLAFGDVLLVLPLAAALRSNPAVSRVDLLTGASFAAVPETSGLFDAVYRIDPGSPSPDLAALRATRYDLLLDLHARSVPLPGPFERASGAVRAERTVRFTAQWATPALGELATRSFQEHAVACYARAAGELVTGGLPEARVSYPTAAVEWAATHQGDALVCLVPGARYAFKRWPAERYATLGRLLRERGVRSVVVGHSFDSELVDVVASAAGVRAVIEPDELRLGALLGRIGVAVTNNSGLMHLAQVSGARCVCVHSHTGPAMWRPWGAGHIDLVGAVTRCDCDGLGDFEAPFPCGKQIAPEAVAKAVLDRVEARYGGLR